MTRLSKNVWSPIISIKDGTFRKSVSGPELFSKLNFELPSKVKTPQAWAIIGGPSEQRTDLLRILRGDYLTNPPSSRTYPFLSSDQFVPNNSRLRSPNHAIKYVGFDAERGISSLRGAYLSARYESRREITDFSLKNYLLGKTELNAAEDLLHHPDEKDLNRISEELLLHKLLDLPVSSLSNGQTRRAKIAKALIDQPEVLLLNSPFMGLDPSTVTLISSILERLSNAQYPRIMLSLSTDEHMPSWISHVLFTLKGYKVHSQGPTDVVSSALLKSYRNLRREGVTLSKDDTDFLDDAMPMFPRLKTKDLGSKTIRWGREDRLDYIKAWERGREQNESKDTGMRPKQSKIPEAFSMGETVVEMEGVKLAYAERTILGDWTQDVEGEKRNGLWWNVRRGERWGVFGPNGSGKTTLTALVSSDHPQAYSLPIKLFGRSRLPELGQTGISIFDLQKRIGFSSPELHAFFPKHLTVRQTLESAWAETPLLKATLTTDIDDKVSAMLRWFQGELCPDIGPSPILDIETYVNPGKSLHRKERLDRIKEGMLDPNSLQWADERRFREVSFPAQRLLLFLRAIIKSPDIVVLDEPYSGMDADVVNKCNQFLRNGETKAIRYRLQGRGPITSNPSYDTSHLEQFDLATFKGLSLDQALVFISHRREEVPDIVREWLCLPEPDTGKPPRFGRFEEPLNENPDNWRDIWGWAPLYKGRRNVLNQTPESKRLAFNAYQLQHYKKETPEQHAKRNARLRNYWRRKTIAQREIVVLRRMVRLPLVQRVEMICNRSQRTIKTANKILNQISY